jgi:hypothetical protein
VDATSLNEEERALMARERLDLRQIGFRRDVLANLRGLARQEFAEDAESCFLASGESVFELSAVDARLAFAPASVESRRNGQLEIWLPPVQGRRYLVAVDPAGGGSEGDYSAAQVVDVETGMQCAEFAAHVGGVELAKTITELAHEYNGAVLVIERNNHGTGVLALCESVCGYGRIYREHNAGWGQLGWLTTSVSRPAVLGRLNAALVENAGLFMSRKLLAELRSFIRHADGSTGAAGGTHDDRVMAMAIGLAARAEVAAAGGDPVVRCELGK